MLQSVLNSASNLVSNRRKYDIVTPLLRDRLHWLPVQYVSLQTCLARLQVSSWCCAGIPKPYCVGVSKSRAGARLRSEVKGDLKIRKSKNLSWRSCFFFCRTEVLEQGIF